MTVRCFITFPFHSMNRLATYAKGFQFMPMSVTRGVGHLLSVVQNFY